MNLTTLFSQYIKRLITPASPNLHFTTQHKMDRDEFYRRLQNTRYSKVRKLRTRVEVFEELENGSFKNKATGRIMSAKTFEIYKPAAAMDGITTILT